VRIPSSGTSCDRQRVDINALVEEALNLAYHGARSASDIRITDYGVGIWMLVRVVPARVNRSPRLPPKVCAAAAIARATNTSNIAYSVAVAPLSSRRKRQVRLCILTYSFRGVTLWQCAPKAITVATQPVARLIQSLSVACQAVVRKAPFVI
jgi:hypothetical protein